MGMALRIILALACWLGAGAAGWWWHRPDAAQPVAAAGRDVKISAAQTQPRQEQQAIAKRLIALDAMGLSRGPVSPPPGVVPGAALPGAAAPSWRVSALVVRGAERYVVLTASGQPPLTVRVGDLLPDGDRIKIIEADHIQIQSPRGRLRTLYLIEP